MTEEKPTWKPGEKDHPNAGNKHAKKDDPKTATLYLRVTPDDKNKFVKQAQKDGKKLSAWALDILRDALP